MKKYGKKKLALKRTTLHTLNGTSLRGVNGGLVKDLEFDFPFELNPGNPATRQTALAETHSNVGGCADEEKKVGSN